MVLLDSSDLEYEGIVQTDSRIVIAMEFPSTACHVHAHMLLSEEDPAL